MQLDTNADGVGDTCTPGSGSCGIGVEIALALSVLEWARRARRRRTAT